MDLKISESGALGYVFRCYRGRRLVRFPWERLYITTGVTKKKTMHTPKTTDPAYHLHFGICDLLLFNVLEVG